MCAHYDETLAKVLQPELTRFINLNLRGDVKSSSLPFILNGWKHGSKPLLSKPKSNSMTVPPQSTQVSCIETFAAR